MGISIKNSIQGIALFLGTVFFSILYGQQPQEFGSAQLSKGSVLTITAVGSALAEKEQGHSYVELSVNKGFSPYQDYVFSTRLQITPLLADGSMGQPYTLNLSLSYSRTSGRGVVSGSYGHVLEGGYIHSIAVLSSSLTSSDGVRSHTVPSNMVLKAGYTSKDLQQIKAPVPKGLGALLNTDEASIKPLEGLICIQSLDAALALDLETQALSGRFYTINPLIHLSNI